MTTAIDPSRIGVGIIGVQAARSWAATAHIPALLRLSDRYRIAGIANSSHASASAAANALGGLHAFASVDELIRSDDVDLVVVCVKVPHHVELVQAALKAGKHVLCEWPLAQSLAEAKALAARATEAGVVAAVGAQAYFAPAIIQMRQLCENASLGSVLSSAITGYGMTWGASIERRNAYLLDQHNGATMLTIAVGHMLSALEFVLGPIVQVSALLATRRSLVTITETGETISMDGPDQVLLHCTLVSGAPVSLHFRGGPPHGDGLVWQIDGLNGSMQLTSPSGLVELAPLTLATSRGSDRSWQTSVAPVDQPAVDGVRRLYKALANRIAGGGDRVPSFNDAIRLHHIIEAVEQAASSGCRVDLLPS